MEKGIIIMKIKQRKMDVTKLIVKFCEKSSTVFEKKITK